MAYYVYMLACMKQGKFRNFYTGQTNDISRRLDEHIDNVINNDTKRYTGRFDAVRKVWHIKCSTRQEALRTEERVKEKFQREIEAINPEINHVEQIKQFTLLSREWTAGDGELTPTTKLKRKVIEAKFEAEIEEMYEG